MNWEIRKKSEEWTKTKANEFVKLESDLTFAEWCYQQGRAEELRKFAEWFSNRDYDYVDCWWRGKDIFGAVEDYKREIKGETEE